MKAIEKVFKEYNDYYITDKFGPREPIKTPSGTTSSFHKGVDYGTHSKPYNQYAVENGVVLEASTSNSCGNYVWIEYPRLNLKMCHYHLKEFYVKKGQKVDNNTLIGITGKTGMATGVHLHLGIFDYAKNDYIDPEEYNYVEYQPVELKYNIGDKVIVNGTLYGDPYGNDPGQTVTDRQTIITRRVEDKPVPYPYNTTGDLGWVGEDELTLVELDYKKLYEEQVAENKKLSEINEELEKRIYGAIEVLSK